MICGWCPFSALCQSWVMQLAWNYFHMYCSSGVILLFSFKYGFTCIVHCRNILVETYWYGVDREWVLLGLSTSQLHSINFASQQYPWKFWILSCENKLWLWKIADMAFQAMFWKWKFDSLSADTKSANLFPIVWKELVWGVHLWSCDLTVYSVRCIRLDALPHFWVIRHLFWVKASKYSIDVDNSFYMTLTVLNWIDNNIFP